MHLVEQEQQKKRIIEAVQDRPTTTVFISIFSNNFSRTITDWYLKSRCRQRLEKLNESSSPAITSKLTWLYYYRRRRRRLCNRWLAGLILPWKTQDTETEI